VAWWCAGTRELVIANTPFVVPYRIRDDHIDILRVYHAARMWPDCKVASNVY
jgi:hypothetical protein